MIALVLGTTHSGKTTLARSWVARWNDRHPDDRFAIISLDDLRNRGFHCPWCGYETEVEPWRQSELDDLVLEACKANRQAGLHTLVEGSAIAPDDDRVTRVATACVLMVRHLTPMSLLVEARACDGPERHTHAKADTYLLRYFEEQQAIAYAWEARARALWGDDISGRVVDATDLRRGVREAEDLLDLMVWRVMWPRTADEDDGCPRRGTRPREGTTTHGTDWS